MDARTTPLRDEAVEEAINRVLKAERDARQAVALCREQAAGLINEARARGRRVSERADARIDAMRAACRCKVSAKLAGLEAQAEALSNQRASAELVAALEGAVQVLVKRLTGEPE
jgi:vacuolar-type H+-ATPase subunit H